MPGQDGFDVLAEIKRDEKTKDIHVIILSNLGQDSDMEKCKKLGASGYLVKAEHSLKEIIEKINSLI